MNELTIIKHSGGAYIDSREAAEVIGKNHKELLRDIRRYNEILSKRGQRNFAPTSFFIESSFTDRWNRPQPCYLLSKMGCELVAHKLTGAKGILFTAAYVQKFNEMEAAERAAEIKSHKSPCLNEFNSAVRNVLSGMSYCCALPEKVIDFLCGVYEPLGIKVLPFQEDDYFGYYTVTEIAKMLGVYSDNGRPHGHAVSAIISKLENTAKHAVVIPYGLVGVVTRYDRYIINSVCDWIMDNGKPHEVPHNGFYYHIYYGSPLPLFDDGDDYEFDFDDEIEDDYDYDFDFDDEIELQL